MTDTIRVHGIREVNAAFRQIDKKLAREFGNDLKKAADPVVQGARSKETRWAGAKIETIRAKRSGPRVFVEQSAHKVTGKRPDFGALQMAEALVPALDEASGEVFDSVEQVLNKYAKSAGF